VIFISAYALIIDFILQSLDIDNVQLLEWMEVNKYKSLRIFSILFNSKTNFIFHSNTYWTRVFLKIIFINYAKPIGRKILSKIGNLNIITGLLNY
jgi:hypothetical protein